MMQYPQWEGFAPGEWQRGIDVRSFIQKNFTLYEGGEKFLAPATARTKAVWEKCEALLQQELEKGVQNGFVKAAWCGCRECEDKVKELYNASTRNMPFDQSDMPSDKCIVCGKPAEKLIYFAKAY